MNKINKFASKENGITLIALVVTVVVLMILLGASITAFKDIDVMEATNEQINVFYNDKQRMANEVDSLTEELDEKNRVYPSSSSPLKKTFTLTCKKDTTILSKLKINIYYVASVSGSTYTKDAKFNSITDNLINRSTPTNGQPGVYSTTTELGDSLVQKFNNIISSQSIEPKYRYTADSAGKITVTNMDMGIYFIQATKEIEKGGRIYKMKPFLLYKKWLYDAYIDTDTYQGYEITPIFEEIT